MRSVWLISSANAGRYCCKAIFPAGSGARRFSCRISLDHGIEPLGIVTNDTCRSGSSVRCCCSLRGNSGALVDRRQRVADFRARYSQSVPQRNKAICCASACCRATSSRKSPRRCSGRYRSAQKRARNSLLVARARNTISPCDWVWRVAPARHCNSKILRIVTPAAVGPHFRWAERALPADCARIQPYRPPARHPACPE